MSLPPSDPADDLQCALTLVGPISRQQSEVAVFVYLDPKWRVIGLRHCPSPRIDAVEPPIREIVRDALVHEARYLLMAHNHPSGDASPSQADMIYTRRLARTLDAIGVTLVDHLVLSADATVSFRRAGLL